MSNKQLTRIEWGILICSLLLVAIGLIALMSATHDDQYEELIKQLTWLRNKYSSNDNNNIY